MCLFCALLNTPPLAVKMYYTENGGHALQSIFYSAGLLGTKNTHVIGYRRLTILTSKLVISCIFQEGFTS